LFVFSDCLENPDYLKIVLQDYFGDAYAIILDLIKSRLEEIEKPPIQQFLKVLAS
jgi:Cys-tRNA synthase (O-phospho-L-seryl-tRNA:Cys-tRNA synthase)